MSLAEPLSPLEQNKRLFLRWLDELWNQGRRETIRELFAKTGVLHHRQGHGPDEFLHVYDIMRAQFSQISVKPIVALAEGDLVCVHWSFDCVYTATRTPVLFTGISIVRIKDGQIVEGWQNWDAAGVSHQVPGIVLP
jgi:predicted SnoaL-like aldol condensation-catalyzing enzyme